MAWQVPEIFRTLANSVLKQAQDRPTEFLLLVCIIVTPLLLISGYLSWRLTKSLKAKETKKGRGKAAASKPSGKGPATRATRSKRD